MNLSRRTTRRITSRAPHHARRRLLSFALLVGFFVGAQGAALAHAHVDGGHDGPCAVCRVADDTGQALQAWGPATFAIALSRIDAAAPTTDAEQAPALGTHAPRAPPIV